MNRLTFVIARVFKGLFLGVFAAVAGALPLLGVSAAGPSARALAAGTIPLADEPYLPGSRIPISVSGFSPPYDVGVLGPGTFSGGVLALPLGIASGDATILAANGSALAMRTFLIAAPPPRNEALIAVASTVTASRSTAPERSRAWASWRRAARRRT